MAEHTRHVIANADWGAGCVMYMRKYTPMVSGLETVSLHDVGICAVRVSSVLSSLLVPRKSNDKHRWPRLGHEHTRTKN